MAADEDAEAGAGATRRITASELEPVSSAELRDLEARLDLDAPTIHSAYDRYHNGADSVPSIDSFLAFLVSEGVIDSAQYRRAVARGRVSVAAELRFLLDAGPVYEMYGTIGEGGMGEIRVGIDRLLRHPVALKTLKRETPEDFARFVTEAQVTAQLDHPNVVPVYGLQVAQNDQVAFAMKLVEGKTLADLIAESVELEDRGPEIDGEHALSTRLEHFVKVCEALGYAHSKGVLHRDLKPANIMIGSHREVYVMDWGVAKVIGVDDESSSAVRAARQEVSAPEVEVRLPSSGSVQAVGSQTRWDSVLGTPPYMSPEQVAGDRDLDPRSDIYSLGLILFELVTLRRAYGGRRGQTEELLDRVSRGQRRPVVHRRVGVDIPADLVAIVAKATMLERAERYQSAHELARDVRRFLRGAETTARPDNWPRRALRVLGRNRGLLLSLALSALLVGVAAVAWSFYTQREAMVRARERERRLSAFQTDVTRRAQKVDRRFVRLEGMLIHLAEKTANLLATGSAGRRRLYGTAEYDAPGRGPPDLSTLTPYGDKRVSLHHPVYVLAPGTTPSLAMPLLRKLLPLRDHYRWMLRRSASRGPGGAAHRPLTDLVRRGRVPIRWTYVGLQEGVMFSFPGKGGYPRGYDPRLRPWYRLGRDSPTPRWGNPYIDLQGQGLVLPAAVGIFGPRGGFLGVAGIEITFDHLIRTYLTGTGSGFTEALLVDARGQVVVSSRQIDLVFRGGRLHDALELEPFDLPEIVRAIRAGREGVIVRERGGRRAVIGYVQIRSIGWYFVAVAPLRR